MRLVLISFRNYKLILNIEERAKADCVIIPIGCDCHPAYLLNSLKLRTQSLPFDWLNMNPIHGIQYVGENIKTKFNLFLSDLKINDRGFIVSSTYSSTEFMHQKDLISNQETKEKLARRCERFNKLFADLPCKFLYNIPSVCLSNEESVIQFKKHVFDFLDLIKMKDRLLIYIRYDESFDENKTFCESLYNGLSCVNRISVQRYVREKEAFGIWGDETKYLKLLKAISNGITRRFPKIYFSW